MTVNVTLLLVMGVMFACGVYLMLERSLTRVLLGIVLVGNGANLLLLATAGVPGLAPIYQAGVDPREYSDPLPQALILTAIVITFAVTAFVLAIIYRSWVIARRDEVIDDAEDRRVAKQSLFDFEEDAVVAADTTEFTGDVDEAAAAARERERNERRLAELEESPGGHSNGRNREAR
jgi:multicomponent Na+:H+ antiporter subunit C